ncbi:MAG: hypothetical protein HY774_02595 [Acidobacteria bacterium]|nr:hypothetical protein [Acidobacteriota bacterium]
MEFRFSPGWAVESSRRAAGFAAHPPVIGQPPLRARMGAGTRIVSK